MAFQPRKKQGPSLHDFLRANNRQPAFLFGPHGLKPAETISGIVKQYKLDYQIQAVDSTTQTPADIDHVIHSREVFRTMRRKIIVLLFIDQVDKIMQEYIKCELLPNVKKKFVILVVDDTTWTPWVGYCQKTTIPHFKLEPPNNNEKVLYLEKLNPYQLVYNEDKNNGVTFHEKMTNVADKITNFEQLESYISGTKSMNGIYDFHTEDHGERNFFKAICFLRSEAHLHDDKQWKMIEDTLDEHQNAVRTLMINQPSFESPSNVYSLKCRSQWLEQFSELDTFGFEKPDLTPCYIASTSWNESYGTWNKNCKDDGKKKWYSVKTIPPRYDATEHNLHSANEYLSNQFSFFDIFDMMTQISQPKWIFQYYCKVVHDPCIINLLVKKLTIQFGILLIPSKTEENPSKESINGKRELSHTLMEEKKKKPKTQTKPKRVSKKK
jgi:hypothetical protein